MLRSLPLSAVEVIHQQVGDVLLRGANTNVGRAVRRQSADQENQAADALPETALVGAVLTETENAFVDLARKRTRGHHFGRKGLVEVVARERCCRAACSASRATES